MKEEIPKGADPIQGNFPLSESLMKATAELKTNFSLSSAVL